MSFYVPVAESKYDNISNLLLCPLIFGLMCALVLPLKYRLSFISSLLHSSTLSVQNQLFSQGVHVLPSLFSHQMSPSRASSPQDHPPVGSRRAPARQQLLWELPAGNGPL